MFIQRYLVMLKKDAKYGKQTNRLKSKWVHVVVSIQLENSINISYEISNTMKILARIHFLNAEYLQETSSLKMFYISNVIHIFK